MGYTQDLASAQAEFDSWFRGLGARTAKRGDPGVHRDRVLTHGPKCFCGRAVRAMGLCRWHYKRQWRLAHGWQPRWERSQVVTCGHSSSPHHAKGLCKLCYDAATRDKRLARRRRRGKLPSGAPLYYDSVKSNGVKCRSRKANCHPDRRHQARGLCKPCYEAWRWSYRERKPTRYRGPILCSHPERKHYAHGKCRPCYRKAIQGGLARKRSPTRWARIPDCHPERKHCANGLCWPCDSTKRSRERRMRGQLQAAS